MEQGYLAQIQALIDLKWKENPEEMKRVMEEIEAKEKAKKEKPKVEAPKVVSFDPQLLTQELIEELNKEEWDDAKIQDLIKRGADVEAKSNGGLTPLYWASVNNAIETAKLLLERGADVKIKSDVGWTPLHVASRRNGIELAKLLIDVGADVNAKDNFGKTPLDWARSAEMRDFLQNYMK